jgi:hypothetical protein
MKTTVDELVMQVSTSAPTEQETVRRHIEALDAIDSRFSSIALRLLTEPRDELAASFVSFKLRSWIVDSGTMTSAKEIAAHRKDQYDLDYYNAPLVVLEGAMAAKSVATMTIPAEYTIPSMIRAASDADSRLTRRGISNRPDLMLASNDELNAYFRPLAVAGIILDIEESAQPFIQKAPDFLSWVRSQSNLDEVLAAALQAKSLAPETIEAFVAMQKTTPQPLHDGLI